MTKRHNPWTSGDCTNCGKALMGHAMHFTHSSDSKVQIDKTKPLRCPLGQFSDWITWEEATE